VKHEFDFLLAIEDVVLRGQIDLWFEESGEQILVDYKTDVISSDEAPARAASYALQLQLYAVAVQRLTGRAPDRALLYFLRPNLAVSVDVNGTALERAAEPVLKFRQSHETQKFPLIEGQHCTRCSFFRGMCPAIYSASLE
jgi:RecB family exonuclease